MPGKVFITRALIGIVVFVMIPYGAFAQDAAPTAEPVVTFSQQELDQMLAPIALYPDSLLAQVLIAATYPDQVMEADRWLKQNPDLKGDALNDALDTMNWDLSVKALAPFPQVLAMMAQEPDWTQRMGEAFLAQQADVMDSVQKLRQKAQAAGNLKTTAEQKVVVERRDRYQRLSRPILKLSMFPVTIRRWSMGPGGGLHILPLLITPAVGRPGRALESGSDRSESGSDSDSGGL